MIEIPGEIASVKHPNKRGFTVVQKWTDTKTGVSEWRPIKTLPPDTVVKWPKLGTTSS